MQRPQKIWVRRALFQIHLWSGIALGLYILMISVTGSVLVYLNELYRALTPPPIISQGSGLRLTDPQLAEAARRLYPDYRVERILHPLNPDQAADVWLTRGTATRKRLFDVRTGADMGQTVPAGIWFVSRMLDLHDNLFSGPTGRKVNAFGALAFIVVGFTGLVIWWPGIKTWRRSLIVPSGVGWKRTMWHLHSLIGFWGLALVIMFGISGFYFGFPEPFQNFADWLQPPNPAIDGTRTIDKVIYWMAYLHFGRINGIGIPCKGPGLCDQAVKATWALFGLVPAAMFVTGAIMWWNRVLRPWITNAGRESRAAAPITRPVRG